MKTIFALFGVLTEYYDQPDNDLQAFWFEKPSYEILKDFFFKRSNLSDDYQKEFITDILNGEAKTLITNRMEYRLEEWKEGAE